MTSIDQKIQAGIQKASAANRFQLTSSQRHTHNDIDSPYVFQPILTYIGLILINGTIAAPAAGAYPGTLPTGWTVNHAGTGDYILTHNLNTTFYACVASPLGTTTAVSLAVSTTQVEFAWFDTATQALTDTPFMFILTTINNKKTKLPTYQ